MKKNDHSPIKNIFKIIVTVFHYVILILAVLMMLFNVFGSLATTLKYFRFSLSRVPTGSMDPTIKPGDYVLIKYLSDEDKFNLKPSSPGKKDGDIIVFQPSGNQANGGTSDISDLRNKGVQYVIHRVVKNETNNGSTKDEDKTLITTKGDNEKTNKESSPYETNLRYEDIRAKHVLIIREFYVYFVFFVVFVLFMFDLYLSYIREDSEEEEEYEEEYEEYEEEEEE
ncbi:S26 family signal peptidase [Candidatus Phytoplasma pruni]|uniref:S26 family signal peptidase n=1 Tax=Candidatus Phytoplasma pruni TaxID=479893 RepID=A0A851HDF4_9MOLU|nr:S26 family signal peptidase [Candidatus Phytoplasma pruni]NWN46095.1 S26 family signal peptidase [Candidatus Phytoplasma pruni]